MGDPPAKIVLQNGAHGRIAAEAKAAGKANQGSLTEIQPTGNLTSREKGGFFLILAQKVGNTLFAFGQVIEMISQNLAEVNFWGRF